MRCLGVMSGTSCDGADLAVVSCSPEIKTNNTGYFPYPAGLREQLLTCISKQPMTIQAFSELDANLGEFYARAINRFLEEQQVDSQSIDGIGLHGQTVHHDAPSNTLQIGSAAIVASRTGIPVVANFRQMDVACGGQGAPLAPILHQQLFARKGQHVGVLNLGGIANITYLADDKILGFDTGPANCLMDEWADQHLDQQYDANGNWAKTGQVNELLLQSMLLDPYFGQGFPKSTGREYFNSIWLNEHLKKHPSSPKDVQRTLLGLTVESVRAGTETLSEELDELIVCGGGVHNQMLMTEMQRQLKYPVKSSAEFGLNPDQVESALMAWLAAQYLSDNQLDLRSVTGCAKALRYGVLFEP